jgi:triacylglycerol lipase
MTGHPDPNVAAQTTSWQNRAHILSSRLLGSALGSGDWAVKLVARKAGHSRRQSGPPAEAAPPRRVVRGLTVERSNHADWPVWTLQAPVPSTRVVLYFHGGGYLGQITKMQYRWCADIARNTGATVVVPIYPLAPLGTAATVIPVAADLIESLIIAHGAENVCITGDSAGGGLALAAVQEAVRRGFTHSAARLVLISPWLDVTISDPASATINVPASGTRLLRAGGRLWAGDDDPAHPRVSPLFGSMAGLPPITVYAGTFDVLYPDTTRLAQRAAAAGVKVETVIADGLVHVWPLYAHLPEARDARPRLHRALMGDG